MTKKYSLIPKEKEKEFNDLYNRFYSVLQRCELNENDENIYQQIISMLTENEVNIIDKFLEIISESNKNYDIHKMNTYCRILLNDKFSFASNKGKRKKLKSIRREDSLKFLRGLDCVERCKIYDDGLPPPPYKKSGILVRLNISGQHQKLLKIYTDNLENKEFKKNAIDKKAIDDSQYFRYEMIHNLDYRTVYFFYEELTMISGVINELKMLIEKIHFNNYDSYNVDEDKENNDTSNNENNNK